MRLDGEVGEAGEAAVGQEEPDPTLVLMQRTASPDDGNTSGRVSHFHLPWEAETVAGCNPVTDVGWAADWEVAVPVAEYDDTESAGVVRIRGFHGGSAAEAVEVEGAVKVGGRKEGRTAEAGVGEVAVEVDVGLGT